MGKRFVGYEPRWYDAQQTLTEKGQLVHQLTTPKRRSGVSGKVYEVKLHKPLVGNEAKVFASGDLKLKSEAKACKPALLEVVVIFFLKSHNR